MASPRTLRWLLLLLSTLAALGVAELGLRIAAGRRGGEESEADLRRRLEASRTAALPAGTTGRYSLLGLVQPSPFPDLVYELKPHLSGTFRGRPLRTNSWGMRGAAEYALEKPAGTFRIVGLGDSHMFGWGVGEGEPYLQILERRLNAAGGRRAEVLNLGTPGYNTTLEVAAFARKGLAFAPDLVIVHFVGNDFKLPHFMQPAPPPPGPSYLLDFLRNRWRERTAQEEEPDLLHDLKELPDDVRQETRGQYREMVGLAGYRKAMDRLAALTRPRRIPVWVLSLNAAADQGALAREVAVAHGFRFLNAAPHFQSWLDGQGIVPTRGHRVAAFQIPGDGHPNANAHARYADFLITELRSARLP